MGLRHCVQLDAREGAERPILREAPAAAAPEAPAATSARSTSSNQQPGVESLLAAKKLDKYTEGMAKLGYVGVDDLLEAGVGEIDKLAKDLHMMLPEVRRFLKVVAELKTA